MKPYLSVDLIAVSAPLTSLTSNLMKTEKKSMRDGKSFINHLAGHISSHTVKDVSPMKRKPPCGAIAI